MAKLQHKPRTAHTASSAQPTGTVMAAHGRHYLVEPNQSSHTVADASADTAATTGSGSAPASAPSLAPTSSLLNCVTRGKRSDVAVGDVVAYQVTSPNQGVIEAITERKTLLYRSDQYRSKLLAANLTQLFIVVATEPAFSDDLICRALIAAEAGGIRPHLIFNKIDVIAPLEKARQRLALYQSLGYPVHAVSAKADPQHALATLLPLLDGQSTILTGKHTTTFVRSYHLNADSIIIDSPGFQEFGLHHLSEGMLERALPEFRPHLGKCKFYNCHHHSEPGCAILAAMHTGEISKMRHDMYEQLVHEAAQTLGYK